MHVISKGRTVSILPLAILSVPEETPGVHRVRVIQTGPRELTVRLAVESPVNVATTWLRSPRTWSAFSLDRGYWEHVLLANERPGPDSRSGKFRQVWCHPAPSRSIN